MCADSALPYVFNNAACSLVVSLLFHKDKEEGENNIVDERRPGRIRTDGPVAVLDPTASHWLPILCLPVLTALLPQVP